MLLENRKNASKFSMNYSGIKSGKDFSPKKLVFFGNVSNSIYLLLIIRGENIGLKVLKDTLASFY